MKKDVKIENKIVIGYFYKDIDKHEGYPRDIFRLYTELVNRNISIYKLKKFLDVFRIRNKVNIIHIFAPFLISSLGVALYCKIYKIPYIISTLSHLMPFAMKKESLKKSLFFMLIGRYLLNGADIVHVFTEYEGDALRKLGVTTTIKNITLGIYPEDIINGKVSNGVKSFDKYKPYLMFMGRLDVYQKGIDILIEGFNQYMEKSKKYRLIICGRDYQNGKQFIKNSIEKNNASGRILFLGEIDEAEKNNLIEKADAFIYPSRFDGPPRPIRFAISKKQKVLVSYESNVIDNLEMYGWGLQFRADSESICKCILDFENKKKWPEYIDPCEILSWNKLAIKYLNMYAGLVNKR